MRVAFLTNVVYPFVTGGAEKRIYEIGTRLADKGHDITIYGRHFWDGPKETNHEGMTLYAVAPETELYVDNRRSITEAIDFATRAMPKLRRHLSQDKHDIVVATVFPYFPVLTAKLTGLGTDIPIVTTWHEVWGEYWNDYLGKLAPFGKIIEQITARIPQFPIAVSGVTAGKLADIGPERSAINVIPNGIDTSQIRTAPLPEEEYDILFAGRLIEHKNVDLLLEAFDEIAKDNNVTLGIIGDGPEKTSLKNRCSSLTHSQRVDFIGFLDEYEEVLGHMRAAEIFVSPSTREGFGITFVEAMAADCTVIAADHPDSAANEVIDGAGFLVDPTVESLTETLDATLSGDRPSIDPVERAQRYDWDTVADQAETAYQQAIDGSW
jgi:glycosyltransferase involved in cell wall biosynthesis